MSSILGVDLSSGQIYPRSDVYGTQKLNLLERVNKTTKDLIKVKEDPIYKVITGEDRDFLFDYENALVINYYNPVFLEDTPLSILSVVDLAENVILDRALSDDTEDIILFINGYACYFGPANGTTFTPYTSTVDDAKRSIGYLSLAADPDNVGVIDLKENRVKLTFQLLGSGTEDIWMSLPKERSLDAAELLFFDKYGACYSNRILNRSNFLSSFTIFDIDDFNQGAVVNELYFLEGYGRQITEFLNFQNADGYELTNLGEKWFGTPKRQGETEENYKKRLFTTILGPKVTPYAIRKALLVFSPDLVIIQEGIRGFGFIGRSFFSWITEGFPASGPYTDIVTPAFFGTRSGSLLRIRIKIESNPVTEDPLNARFIFELVQSIKLHGVEFEIEKI